MEIIVTIHCMSSSHSLRRPSSRPIPPSAPSILNPSLPSSKFRFKDPCAPTTSTTMQPTNIHTPSSSPPAQSTSIQALMASIMSTSASPKTLTVKAEAHQQSQHYGRALINALIAKAKNDENIRAKQAFTATTPLPKGMGLYWEYRILLIPDLVYREINPWDRVLAAVALLL